MSKSPNHYNGRNGWKPDIICCHVTEGGFSGAVSWLCNPAAQCSAHFVVGANGQKEQLVDFKDGAWCNGNSTNPSSRLYYKNALNPIVRSRATNANHYTYSIEHEGYSYKDRYGALTEAQYQATLDVIKLMINDMKNTYGVIFTPDREHLIGHYAIDPKGKPNCPSPNQGGNFPFDRLLNDIKVWMGKETKPEENPAGTTVNIGDIVTFNGGAVYTSADAPNAAATRGESRCKVTNKYNGKHPYHLISQDGKGVYGWVDAVCINGAQQKPNPPEQKPEEKPTETTVNIGDIVTFNGGAVYASSDAPNAAATRGESRCKVTNKYNGKHPYHLISQDGKGVYGWVDTTSINGASQTPAPQEPKPLMRKGAKVQYSGPLYANSNGGGRGKTVNGTYVVSIYIPGRKCGVHLGAIGWVEESNCKVIG